MCRRHQRDQMEEIDMSRPGSELFPETSNAKYNSYSDVIVDQVVDDPLNTGVNTLGVAGQEQQQMSEKELNFRALREEAAKLQSEREYWKGQAEAYSKMPARQSEVEQPAAPSSFDWEDSKDVARAYDALRQENDLLRSEMKDAIAAVQTKAQHHDWNDMVTRNVPELTSKNPIFAEMIKNSSNPYEAAYVLSELNSKGTQQQQQPVTGMNAQRAIQNSQKPQTLASVGGHGTLSSADYYANMSDEDFMKIAGRNLANI